MLRGFEQGGSPQSSLNTYNPCVQPLGLQQVAKRSVHFSKFQRGPVFCELFLELTQHACATKSIFADVERSRTTRFTELLAVPATIAHPISGVSGLLIRLAMWAN